MGGIILLSKKNCEIPYSFLPSLFTKATLAVFIVPLNEYTVISNEIIFKTQMYSKKRVRDIGFVGKRHNFIYQLTLQL
jgi:hypothetical protein